MQKDIFFPSMYYSFPEYGPGDDEEETKTEYDKHGDVLLQELNFSGDAFIKTYIYIYDAKQNIINVEYSEKEKAGGIEPISSNNLHYTYKYDKYGNWTERKVIDNDNNTPIYFVEREIKYFSTTTK